MWKKCFYEEGNPEGQLTLYYSPNNFSYYIIRADLYSGDHRKIVDQILSTFKFISPQASTTDTTGWKTYTNEEYGFEFKYPQSVLGLEEEESSGTLAVSVQNVS